MIAENEIYNAMSIEREIEQAESTNQPIQGAAPVIFTARKDGVIPDYDIRTDRWEKGQEAMDKIAASYRAKRAEYIKGSNNEDIAEA